MIQAVIPGRETMNLEVDVVVNKIGDAFDLLIETKRLKATLRR